MASLFSEPLTNVSFRCFFDMNDGLPLDVELQGIMLVCFPDLSCFLTRVCVSVLVALKTLKINISGG